MAGKWEDETGTLLEPLDPDTTDYGVANSINDKNEIVGAITGYGERPMGCLWNASGELENVFGTGWASDMNNSGQTIGVTSSGGARILRICLITEMS